MFCHKCSKKDETYYLHRAVARSRKCFVYFFSKDAKDGLDLPSEYEVAENPRSGYPFLRKKHKE